MKKVMLLVLTVMLISAFLMASGPSLRIVRLTIINKSGNDVMMKLEGSDIGKQFYYLTVPAGTKTFPNVSSFTVLEDIYSRTTWYGEGKYAQCVGTSSSGQLVMASNVRLTFTDCYTVPRRNTGSAAAPVWAVNNGEPTMEKVVFYQTVVLSSGIQKTKWAGDGDWSPWGSSLNVYWKRGCGNEGWAWYISSKRVPTRGLCQWRYLYDKTHEW
jgi:hypothetical protein